MTFATERSVLISSPCGNQALEEAAGPFHAEAKTLIAAFPLLNRSRSRLCKAARGEKCPRRVFFAANQAELAAIIALFAAKRVQIEAERSLMTTARRDN